MKFTENIHAAPNVQANSYLIVDTDGLTVVGTGMPYRDKQTKNYVCFNKRRFL